MLKLKSFRIKSFRSSSSSNNEEDTDQILLKKDVEPKYDRDIEMDYELGEHLGSGKFGEVAKCKEIATGMDFACKKILIKVDTDRSDVMNEVKIMKLLRHPRLIQLYDVYSLTDCIYLILELITGGELFERIIDDNFDLNESKCAFFMREILLGMEYIHSQKVVHLDMKPENILCLTKTGYKIKIIDFGLAKQLDPKKELRVLFGTPEFVAPEIIAYDPVTTSSDMWSIGVICYVLLSGLSPFMDDTEADTLNNIIRVNYSFEYSEFKDISQDAKDFIKKLLIKDSRKRLSASDCLSHTWIKNKNKMKRSATVNKKRLKNYVYRRKWQKAINAIIALRRMGFNLTNLTNDQLQSRDSSIGEVPGSPISLSSSRHSSQYNLLPKSPSRRASLAVNMNKGSRKGSVISFQQQQQPTNKPQSPLSVKEETSESQDTSRPFAPILNLHTAQMSPFKRQLSTRAPSVSNKSNDIVQPTHLPNSSSCNMEQFEEIGVDKISPLLSSSSSIKSKKKTKSPSFIQKFMNQKSST